MQTSMRRGLIAARLPQVLLMHDPSHDSQVRPRARKATAQRSRSRLG